MKIDVRLPQVKRLSLVVTYDNSSIILNTISSCASSLEYLNITIEKEPEVSIYDILSNIPFMKLKIFVLNNHVECIQEDFVRSLSKVCPMLEELVLNCPNRTGKILEFVSKHFKLLRNLSIHEDAVSARTFTQNLSDLIYLERLLISTPKNVPKTVMSKSKRELNDQSLLLAVAALNRSINQINRRVHYNSLKYIYIQSLCFNDFPLFIVLLNECPHLQYLNFKYKNFEIGDITKKFFRCTFDCKRLKDDEKRANRPNPKIISKSQLADVQEEKKFVTREGLYKHL
ncbi:hypothetical protein AKO1_002424 [Acrasis kona]